MKKTILLSGLVAGAMLSMVGCGGSGDEGQSIVGTWTSGCEVIDGGSEVTNLIVDTNGTAVEESKDYYDNNCKEISDTDRMNLNYKIGELTKDNHGKTTVELNIKDESGEDYYTMYRFKENGNLLVADDSRERPGDVKERRANEIDPASPGLTRVK